MTKISKKIFFFTLMLFVSLTLVGCNHKNQIFSTENAVDLIKYAANLEDLSYGEYDKEIDGTAPSQEAKNLTTEQRVRVSNLFFPGNHYKVKGYDADGFAKANHEIKDKYKVYIDFKSSSKPSFKNFRFFITPEGKVYAIEKNYKKTELYIYSLTNKINYIELRNILGV